MNGNVRRSPILAGLRWAAIVVLMTTMIGAGFLAAWSALVLPQYHMAHGGSSVWPCFLMAAGFAAVSGACLWVADRLMEGAQ